ncbi:hypothetical protein Hdeb2414_s0017g00513801 [Helianthus debilis subsp. tardiflorus]
MHEKKLRYWFVKDGKRKRTPKASPTISAPKESTPKIVVKGSSVEPQPRLVDDPVLNPVDVIQQGVGLIKESLEGLLKKIEEAAAAGNSVQVESVKEKEPEGVVHTDSSDADDESTETEQEIDMSNLGVGKVTLKKKPPKKKKKGSDDEDSTYMPTAEEKEITNKAQSCSNRRYSKKRQGKERRCYYD